MVVVDWRDFIYPNGFVVRYYDDKLNYTRHSVLPYKTSFPNQLIYKVMRSADKVKLWLTEDEVISQLQAPGYHNYLSFSKNNTVPGVLCATLSQRGNLVVVDDDSIQPGLF